MYVRNMVTFFHFLTASSSALVTANMSAASLTGPVLATAPYEEEEAWQEPSNIPEDKLSCRYC